jgi:MFS family permease
MTDTIRHGSFTRLWLAIGTSTIGNFLLMLSLSVHVHRETRSNFAAAAVFATQWLAALFSAPIAGWLLQRLPGKRLAAYCEWCGAACSLAIGACLGVLPLVFVALFARGLAESVGKSARVVALREHVPAALLERSASLMGTATFLGISLGSLLGAALADRLAIPYVALIDALTFVVSSSLYLSLSPLLEPVAPPAATALGGVVARGLAVLRGEPKVAKNFYYAVVTTAFFQGFHNIARTALPIEHLNMGDRGVMWLQALASGSFFLGAILVTLLMQAKHRAGKIEPWILCAVTAALMLLSLVLDDRVGSLAAYAMYLLSFEVAFTFCQKNMITLCSRETVGLVSPLAVSAATFGMVVVIYLGGWLSDRVTLFATGASLCVALVASMLAIELASIARGASNHEAQLPGGG